MPYVLVSGLQVVISDLIVRDIPFYYFGIIAPRLDSDKAKFTLIIFLDETIQEGN